MSFLGDVFLDFNPFGCYMNHEKNKRIIFGGSLVAPVAEGLYKIQRCIPFFGGVPILGSWETQQKEDNFPGELLQFWMNRLMSLTTIFGEKGAFKVLFAPNLYC